MTYLDNTKKFTCVLNGKVPVPMLMNAMAHATIGLVGQIDPLHADILKYPSKEGRFTALISRWPFIVLKAKNGNQLRTLQSACCECGVIANVFTSTMIGGSAEDQIRQTALANEDELEYWAVALFGAADQTEPLTKKFSLFG